MVSREFSKFQIRPMINATRASSRVTASRHRARNRRLDALRSRITFVRVEWRRARVNEDA